jgi:molybdopterin converting factor small subunit
VADVVVRFWAGAQRAAGCAEQGLAADTLDELVTALGRRPELAKVCAAASFLVDGVQAGGTTKLHDGAIVDVLPPFAGG